MAKQGKEDLGVSFDIPMDVEIQEYVPAAEVSNVTQERVTPKKSNSNDLISCLRNGLYFLHTPPWFMKSRILKIKLLWKKRYHLIFHPLLYLGIEFSSFSTSPARLD